MPQITLELDGDKVKQLIFQLPPSDLVALAEDVNDRAETIQMMRLAEMGFREWNEEEDLYDTAAPSR